MKPMIFTFGYYGWGPHVSLMKAVFTKHNKATRGRSLKWLDTRINRRVRAAGFHGNKVEDLLGRRYYRWLPEFGNIAVEAGGKMRLNDFNKGVEIVLEEIALAQKTNMDIVLFCHDEFYEDCHRKLVVESLKKSKYGKTLTFHKSITGDTEFPFQSFKRIDMNPYTEALESSPSTIRIPLTLKIKGLISPLVVAPRTIVLIDTEDYHYELEIKRPVPSADEKFAKWAILSVMKETPL